VIRETIVTTQAPDGSIHFAPIGIIEETGGLVIAPFRPSQTLENLRRNPYAVANFTDDVLIFAGCLTGRRDWPTRPAEQIPGAVLTAALAHAELTVARVTEHPERPRFHCRILHEATHTPFRGFNRAQAAVIEAAILVSRLHLLPQDKIDHDISYLRIAVEKTAGPREEQAWGWLMERIEGYKQGIGGGLVG
jgi:uncharacterized protein